MISCSLCAQLKKTAIQDANTVYGTFTLPETEKYLTLKFDCSKTLFEKKYNEADWALLNGADEWEKAKAEALERIVEMMNEKMTNTRIIMVLESMGNANFVSNYTMYITPISLDKKGRNKSAFVIKNNETGELLGYNMVDGRGGHFGSLGNLLGDGYEDCAPRVAKVIAKHNKNKKK